MLILNEKTEFHGLRHQVLLQVLDFVQNLIDTKLIRFNAMMKENNKIDEEKLLHYKLLKCNPLTRSLDLWRVWGISLAVVKYVAQSL